MPEIIELSPSSRWVELRATNEDWKKADPKLLGTLLAHLHLIRAFEETVVKLAMEGLVHEQAHSSIGQEGGGAGSIDSITTPVQVTASHRVNPNFLRKALAAVPTKTD